MTSLADRSLDPERRRRPTPRPGRRETPWGIYAGLWLVVMSLTAYASQTGAAWPLWVIGGGVVVLVAWLAWDLWRERRGP